MENRPEILRLTNINKSFPGVKALTDMCFSLRKGEVHALVGENGAGKSTLMKILSGAYKKDSGTIEVEPCRDRIPKALRAAWHCNYLSGAEPDSTGLCCRKRFPRSIPDETWFCSVESDESGCKSPV